MALLVLAGVAAANAPTAVDSSFSIPGTEAQKAFDLLDQRFPGMNADGATARVVFKAGAGGTVRDAGTKEKIEKTVAELKSSSPQVDSASDPFTEKTVSEDGTIAYTSVDYKVSPPELKDADRDALQETVARARASGLTVELGGDALQADPEAGGTEFIGIAMAAVVLVVTFGSLVAAGLPLLTALIGVGIGVCSVTALAKALDLGTDSSTLAMMIGLAVGIDYALFIVSRYRSELADGWEREEAMGRAVGAAGSAVVFAGLTVVIALAGLAVVNLPMLTKMGGSAAGTVAIAVLIALTMIPALLGYVGKRVYGRRARRENAQPGGATAGSTKPNAGTRWAGFVLRHPVAVLLAAVLGLGATAIPVASLELGLPDGASQPAGSTQRKAYDLLSEGFGPGFNGPLIAVVDVSHAADPKASVDGVAERVRSTAGVAKVSPAMFNDAGDTALLTVVSQYKPSSVDTEEVVQAIRAKGKGIKADTGAELMISGATAMNIDFSQKLNDALVPYLALVVGLAFLLLVIVFRSILVPLKAALGFLLSVLAALGAVVAVFQWGWLAAVFGVEQPGPIMSMMPIFMVGLVFGLAMDYEVFLVTRMREAYVGGEAPAQAIVTGFRHGARVVTAAAVIMISVFSGFIGSSEQMVKMIGFGLGISVFFDAFLVRMTIVPAVLALLGDKAWWLPGWLGRLLPNVDVEGAGLPSPLRAGEGLGEPETADLIGVGGSPAEGAGGRHSRR
ncbi:RND superfamily putative drug exporter [Kitasatospora gansuensis]|uniref:RND superfamily putative drug exporter n=1 Tax=Kitasatospora gansuensis TaxID=258050 RepID=A0A7W7SDH9_9ACTN|nr:RND superfamily putative drug exporter [Kitasatospora gansuensis]